MAPVVKGERAGRQFGLRECDGRRAPVREKWCCAGAICERDAGRGVQLEAGRRVPDGACWKTAPFVGTDGGGESWARL